MERDACPVGLGPATVDAHGGDITRRGFVGLLMRLSFAVSAFFGVGTLLEVMLPPGRTVDGKLKPGWLRVAKFSDITVGTPRVVEYGDDYVYLISTVSGHLNALNAACPHVRCKLGWNARDKRFDCPCHTSSFTITGKRLWGPAQRDMFAMKLRLQGDEVFLGGWVDDV